MTSSPSVRDQDLTDGPAAVTRPRPAAAPVYPAGSAKLSVAEARSWGLDDVLDALFFAAAALAALWLAWLLLGSGWHLEPWAALNVLLFWVVLAYLALPRLHQVLTWLYVPEYFIGRTRTADGLLGDPVNLAVQGHEEDIHEAMTAAGWVRADPISLRTSWNIVVSSLLRRSYPAAPVSDLLLFGRKQDFAYQKEVEGNPAQRHHIRFWHAPSGWVMPGGRRVEWLAAATYDRSVGLSTLTFQVTHKIDANIDVERNYVVDDVLWANQAAELSVWPDFFTAYHDKNGGGDRVVTDGDLYVLDLNEVVPGLRGSSELAEARQAEAAQRRRRPPELVVAVALLVLVTLANVFRLVTSGVVGTLADGLEGAGVADERGAVLTVAVTVTVLLMTAVAGLGAATWFGHPRGRIALMVFLTLHIINTMTQVSAVGERQVGWGLIASASLSVLALLAMSARSCHEWERARKAERLRGRKAEAVRGQ